MWWFPWLSYVAIAAMILVLLAMSITPSHFVEFWTSMISIGITLLAYVVLRRGKHRKQASGEQAGSLG
jgi:GABA permease